MSRRKKTKLKAAHPKRHPGPKQHPGRRGQLAAAERAAGLVCLGEITGAHGVGGAVRVKGFTEDASSLTSYGPLFDVTGTKGFPLTVVGEVRDVLICRIEGVGDREAAQALRGTRLCVRRSALPDPATEEFYYADLLGLRVERRDGKELGELAAIHNFGAGDILEVALVDGGVLDLPFTRAVVPEIDLAAGRIVVEPPELCGQPEPEKKPEKKKETE
jgi:16S rRNA processing protein RimM